MTHPLEYWFFFFLGVLVGWFLRDDLHSSASSRIFTVNTKDEKANI